MAIKPKKQTSSNRGETGGGAPRGGSRGMGGSKPAPKPNVTLKPEPSSMKVKPGKYNLFGADEAAAANRAALKARSRTNPASAKVEKRALKAANKTLKTKSADAARKQSFDRVQKAIEKRKADYAANKPVKELNDSMKFARKNSLRFNPDGSRITPRQAAKDNKAFVKGGKKPSRLSKAIAKKLYPKGVPSSKKK